MGMKWEKEAEELLRRVPFFVRKRVKRAVEEYVSRKGRGRVTARDLLEAKEALRDRASKVEEGFAVEDCFGCDNAVISSDALPSQVEEVLGRAGLTEFLQKKAGEELKHHHQFRVVFSCCPNACSQGQIRDVAFIGRVEPVVQGPCSRCGACEEACEEGAIRLTDSGPQIDPTKCLGCGACIKVCPEGTIREGQKGYRLLVGGKLGRHPRLATELLPLVPKEEVLRVVEALVNLYKELNEKGERLGTVIQRVGWQKFCESFKDRLQQGGEVR